MESNSQYGGQIILYSLTLIVYYRLVIDQIWAEGLDIEKKKETDEAVAYLLHGFHSTLNESSEGF